jgi:hypothetical protein
MSAGVAGRPEWVTKGRVSARVKYRRFARYSPNDPFRRNPVVAARSGGGLFTEPTAAVRPW